MTDVGYLLKNNSSLHFIGGRTFEELEQATDVVPDVGAFNHTIDRFENGSTDVSVGINE